MAATESKRVTELRQADWWEFVAVEAHEAALSIGGEVVLLPSRMYYGQLLSWDVPLGPGGLVHIQIGIVNAPRDVYCEKSIMVEVMKR